MASVHAYQTAGGRRYYVSYYKPDRTQTTKRGFRTKRDAEEFAASVSVAVTRNQYIDPVDSRIAVATLADVWLQDQAAVLKPSSMHPLESAWRVHVKPRWGRGWYRRHPL